MTKLGFVGHMRKKAALVSSRSIAMTRGLARRCMVGPTSNLFLKMPDWDCSKRLSPSRLIELSRDVGDSNFIFKNLNFSRVEIITLADGVASELIVNVKGLVGSLQLSDLSQKTRRGHFGRLAAGRVPGGKLYGYDVVPGEEKGLRSINMEQAAIVRRIFEEYAAGKSPRKIVRDLNAERIPSPKGGLWNSSTITGNVKRQNGIIHSRLYVGEIVYNRERMIKDPTTGKRVHLVNPVTEWKVQSAPGLEIIPLELFSRVQRKTTVLGQRKLHHRPRPKHLFSGSITCGCCGHPMIIINRDRLGCSGRTNKSICDNQIRVPVGHIETRVLGVIGNEILAPDLVDHFVKVYRADRDRLAGERQRARDRATRDLASIEAKIARLIAAIEVGGDVLALTGRLRELEAQRLAAATPRMDAVPDNVLAAFPEAAQRLRDQVKDLAAVCRSDNQHATAAREFVRELVTGITVSPADGGRPAITVRGNLSAFATMHDAGGSGTRT